MMRRVAFRRPRLSGCSMLFLDTVSSAFASGTRVGSGSANAVAEPSTTAMLATPISFFTNPPSSRANPAQNSAPMLSSKYRANAFSGYETERGGKMRQ